MAVRGIGYQSTFMYGQVPCVLFHRYLNHENSFYVVHFAKFKGQCTKLSVILLQVRQKG